jgi:hypothetical protein
MLAITSPTSGGRSVGIVHSRTQAMEFVLFVLFVCLMRNSCSCGRSKYLSAADLVLEHLVYSIMVFRKINCDDVDSIQLVQDEAQWQSFVKMVMNPVDPESWEFVY